jgi:AraC family transcriptional regulator, regulatory protein of adaptative response / methylated-DNA-[protein]-cysteine methyltransferase
MVAGATEEGICLLEFADRKALESELLLLEKYLAAQILPGTHKWLTLLAEELDGYFRGKRQSFDIPLVFPGTQFQISVWKNLISVPFGSVASYKLMAEISGKPNAVRAFARANGQNRIAILIPCHRVIGSDGSLVGYSGGLWRKRWLLDMEAGKIPESICDSRAEHAPTAAQNQAPHH